MMNSALIGLAIYPDAKPLMAFVNFTEPVLYFLILRSFKLHQKD